MQNDDRGKTPRSNRGVVNPSPPPLSSCVDWFSCTFFNVKKWQELCGIICVPESYFSVKEKGINGYSKSAVWDNIQIYFDGHNENMGMFLNMSGQGCRQFEETFKETGWGWSDFFEYVMGYNMNITRIDLAIDDFTGYFTLKQIEGCIRRGCVASRFRTARNFEEFLLEDGLTNGQTIYFGKTDVIIRFYDKYRERINKGYALNCDIDFWQRTEIQLRGDRAFAAIQCIVQNELQIGNFIKGVLNRYLAFKIKGTQKDRAKWKNCKWWEKFLNGVDKIKLSLTAPEKTILRTKDWIDTQICASVATLYEALGDDTLFLEYILNRGKTQMSDKQKELASDFKLDLNKRLMVKDQMKQFLTEIGIDPRAKKSNENESNYIARKLQSLEHEKKMLERQFEILYDSQKYLEELASKYGEHEQLRVNNYFNVKGELLQYDSETGELLFHR